MGVRAPLTITTSVGNIDSLPSRKYSRSDAETRIDAKHATRKVFPESVRLKTAIRNFYYITDSETRLVAAGSFPWHGAEFFTHFMQGQPATHHRPEAEE